VDKPVIEVGILSSETIHFKLNGKFRYCTGEETCEMEGKATTNGNSSFSLELNSTQQQFNDFILLEPLDEEECSFELYNVIIGVKSH